MEITKVTNEDGIRAGQLANFLKQGRWDMNGEQAAVYTLAVRWFHALCVDMAKQIPKGAPPPGPEAPKVKGVTGPDTQAPLTSAKPEVVGPNVRKMSPSTNNTSKKKR
jgi:hypothetical protein